MVLRTSIDIAPNTLQDLTIDNLDKEGTPFENDYPIVLSRDDLESMIFDDIIETDVVAASDDERFTFSSTDFNIVQKTFSELSDLAMADTPLIMTPSLDVSVLSDGTNSYAIKDTQARSDIASLQTNKVPTTRTVNGKALSSDITLTASDVGAADSTATVNLTGNQTIGGDKTFSNNITITKSNPYFIQNNTNITKGTAPASNINVNNITYRDTNGKPISGFITQYATNKNVQARVIAYKSNASTDDADAYLRVYYNADGHFGLVLAADNASSDTNDSLTANVTNTTNTTIPCMGWVNAKLAALFTSISGYDATKTQTLKNVNGTLKWVTD